MSRCWAVRERLGRVAHRGAALTPPDLGRLLHPPPLAPGHAWSPTPSWHMWDVGPLRDGAARLGTSLCPLPRWWQSILGAVAFIPPPSLASLHQGRSQGCPASPPVQGWARAMGEHGGISGGMKQFRLAGTDEPMAFWGASLIASPRCLRLASLLPAVSLAPPWLPKAVG